MTSKSSITKDRLYSPDYICKECKHVMRLHNMLGCKLPRCLCEKQNLSFKQYIHSFARFFGCWG